MKGYMTLANMWHLKYQELCGLVEEWQAARRSPCACCKLGDEDQDCTCDDLRCAQEALDEYRPMVLD